MHLLAWLPLASSGITPRTELLPGFPSRSGTFFPFFKAQYYHVRQRRSVCSFYDLSMTSLRRSHQDPGMIWWIVYGALSFESILQFPCDFLLGGPAIDTRREMHVHLEAGETASENRRKPFMTSQRAHQSYYTDDSHRSTAIILDP